MVLRVAKRVTRLSKFAPLLLMIARTRVARRGFPVRLDFNITKRCNLRCKYCYIDFEDLKQQPDLTLDQIKRAFDDWYRLGTRWTRLLGGEPLLRKDIGEIVRYCKAKGIIVEINTNGYMLEKRFDDIREVDSICISIDGNEKIHDVQRGEGSYRAAIHALDVAKAGDLPVRIHSLLTPDTVDTLDEFASLAKEYDVPFSFGGYMSNPEPTAEASEEMELSPSQLFEFYRKYREYKDRGYPVANSYSSIDALLRWPHGETKLITRENNKTPRNCDNGYYSCFIDADGMVYACPTMWKVGINYFEHGAKASWEYLNKHLMCAECVVCPRDFKSILDLDVRVIMSHVAGFLKRGY